MALKDKLMTLEDFKAVRDVDVASNSAQFTEIKADLDALDNKVLSDNIKNALITCLGDVVMKSGGGATAYNTLCSLLMDESWDYEWNYSDGIPDENGLTLTNNSGTITLTSAGLNVATADSSSSSVLYKYMTIGELKSKVVSELTFKVNSFTSRSGGGVRLISGLGGTGSGAKKVATILFTQEGIKYLSGSTWTMLYSHTYSTNTEYTLKIEQTEDTAKIYVDGELIGTLSTFEEVVGPPQFTAHRGVSALFVSYKLRIIQ